MTELALAITVCTIAFWVGVFTNQDSLHSKCVEKYSSMPHNAVSDHCKQILKFEK